jgi:DNA-directed RNA polymerase specialized sigma24 family protein
VKTGAVVLEARSVAAALASQSVYERLLLLALRRGLSLEDAQDSVGEAIVKLLEWQQIPAKAWNPAAKPLWEYLRDVVVNHRRGWTRQAENAGKERFGDEHEGLVFRRPFEEKVLFENDMQHMEKRCADETRKGIGWRVVRAIQRGALSNDEIAQECRCTVPQVKEARGRLQDRMAAINGERRRNRRTP